MAANSTGDRFGRLTLIAEVERETYARRWLCVCDCGEEKIVLQQNLRSGQTRTCGRCIAARPGWTGVSRTQLYVVWQDILQRCNNPRSHPYPFNGGRGVQVCDEWRASFDAFRDWSYAAGYALGLSLSRKDKSGDYEPANCEWVPPTMAKRKRGAWKISDEDVRKLRAEHEDGAAVKTLAARYNLAVSSVYSLVSGQRRRDVR
jgi:hypothetical protein